MSALPQGTAAPGQSGRRQERVSRREVLTVVGVTAILWLVASQLVLFVPLRILVTLVHEAGHAVMATLLGGDVLTVTVNNHGGGLMASRAVDPSTSYQVLVASAGYVGTAIVGATMLELSRRLRGGRVALAVLGVIVAAIGLVWVPGSTRSSPGSARPSEERVPGGGWQPSSTGRPARAATRPSMTGSWPSWRRACERGQ